MACVGRTKECTIVPSNHYGPIPGIPVGTMWRFRVQVPPDFLGSGAGPTGTGLPEAPAPGQGPPWGQVTGLDFRPGPSTVWLRLGASGGGALGTGVIGFGRKVRPLALEVGARRVGLSCSVQPVPKVPFITWWFAQVSESGVHRPHVAGIHGRSNDGAYSLVLAGGYEDDVVSVGGAVPDF